MKVFLTLVFCSVVCSERAIQDTHDCGRPDPGASQLGSDVRDAGRGEVPWHAAVYRTTPTPHRQICGGSVVTTTVVISAAHCFWRDVDKKQPASHYAVAVGKLYRDWNNPIDTDAQTSEVVDIKIPPRFQGSATNFQDDIALVILKTAIVFGPYVRPVCLVFDYSFDKNQLKVGNKGKVAGWRLAGEDKASRSLQTAEVPYVDITTCIEDAPPTFREFITSDKICAGNYNSTINYIGNSGGGLAFPTIHEGFKRYYLRGVSSTGPRGDDGLLPGPVTFTHILKHENLIKEHL